jgi:hypothetical protein
MARRRSVDPTVAIPTADEIPTVMVRNGLAAGGVHGVPKLVPVVLCAAPGRTMNCRSGLGSWRKMSRKSSSVAIPLCSSGTTMTGACTLSGSTTGRVRRHNIDHLERIDDRQVRRHNIDRINASFAGLTMRGDVDLLVPFRCAQQPFRSVLSLAFAAASVCHWIFETASAPPHASALM